MPKEMDLIKFNAIKSYVKRILKMKISKTATDEVRIRFNDVVKTILREGTESAKDNNRETIMPRDISPLIENQIGKKNLSWEEVFDEVKGLDAIELGNLTKAVTKYIKKEK